ncbi:MAG: sigma-54-dependent Fis family transcriptional regulator [Nitrospirae bacterium]|nr:sigma-54-dependent Fis family transcriptional regulator [Nitrospirota bacterium]
MELYPNNNSFENIKTVDPNMIETLKIAGKAAMTIATVLITGESGTGKELVAKGIHKISNRARGPFIPVNCGAIPSELIESELMGYERGAFTGAISRRIGDFECANGGTIFLDEISSLPFKLQSKLLRVIQEREIKRIGSGRLIELDIRIIAAANVDLAEEVEKGCFRHDLYFRLNIIPIALPPLRDRKGDIPVLVEYLIKKICKKLNKNIQGYSSEIISVFAQYSWPGNIRELENIIERVIVLMDHNRYITIKDLPPNFIISNVINYQQVGEDNAGLKEKCMVYEKTEIVKALCNTKWNRGKAARLLKIHRNTLIQKMKKLDIPVKAREEYDL